MTTLWFESALLPHGWASRVRLASMGACIARVEPETNPSDADERHAIGLPGLPNVHSHAFQRGLAGLTERRGPPDDSFWTWRELMYQFVERANPEDVEAISAQAFAEMLEAGFTRVGEFHYLHHDRRGVPFADPAELALRIVAAAAETGIGLTLLPTFYAHSNFGGQDPTPRQRRFINDLSNFARIIEASRKVAQAVPSAIVGLAPHSLRAVTPKELTAVVQLAQGSAIHIHIAEQTKEVDDCIAWCGRRPIEWLLENQKVNDRWCLVHATHGNEAELRKAARAGAVVGLCPLTESNLGDGTFPAAEFLAVGGRISIGSDSNILLDAAEELRTLEYSQRLTKQARNVLASTVSASTGRSLYMAALFGGSQALNPEVKAVGLQPGAPMDVVSLTPGHPALIERRGDDILDGWIFCAGRAAVDCVWRAGTRVVTGGRHHLRDAIMARYRRALKRLIGAR
jgi:formiminoglutamate deiminase